MAPCSENKNPLKRNGTSQPERQLAALKPGYVRVDEHEYQDWIVFANEFAAFLNYFDTDNNAKGDWTTFFTSDISSQLGSIAIQNIDIYREAIKKRFDFLKKDDNRNDIDGLEENLNDLFSALLTLSKAIDDYLQKLPDEIILKNTLVNLIQTKLSVALYRLIGYYKAAANPPLEYLKTGTFSNWRILNKNVVDAAVIIDEGLSNNWWLIKNNATLINYAWLKKNKEKVEHADTVLASLTSWDDYANSIVADDSILSSALADSATDIEKEYLRIQHAANHNLFSSIFDQYLFAFTKIAREASAELVKTLTGWDSHQPHYALFLSFLKLFRLACDESNTITKRHLDFYYTEVLRLKPKEAIPNKAHVLVELAKRVDSYLLAKGTPLKDGKDSKGVDVFYTLDQDSTFNKAKVTALSSVYLASADDSIIDTTLAQNNAGRLFASPIANSQDGLGARLTGTNKEWHPYVHKEFKEGVLAEIAMPEAAIGFAIASHYLYLTEGERTLTVKLVTPQYALLHSRDVTCYLTTAKGWHKLAGTITIPIQIAGNDAFAQVSFMLTGDLPAIENYNAAVHGGTFNCTLPVLKIMLLQNDALPYDYVSLRDITLSSISLTVEVGKDTAYSQKGLKNLLLSNDAGPLDAAKPFMPFGANPNKDAGFVIGNKEIFSKKNLDLKVNIEWANHPGDDSLLIDYEPQYIATVNPTTHVVTYTAGDEGTIAPKAYITYLAAGIWNKVALPIDLFVKQKTQAGTVLPLNIPNNFFEQYDSEYLPFNNKTNKGFIRFVLERDFGYKAYLADLTEYLMEQAAPTLPKKILVKPTEPYTPLIQSIYLSYSASQTINLISTDETAFNNREIRFFHIYPFGEAEQHNYLNKKNDLPGNIYLLPQFRHAADKYHAGEFYIGIDNLQGGQAVNILFQVLEGSTDPLTSKPPDQITWSYLSNNVWFDFTDQQISDATLDLLQSGIISFAIPLNATTSNTLLSAGKIWIRAAIAIDNPAEPTMKNAAEAIPRLISVDAQAAVSTFTPNNNADDFLNQPLPAEAITKLKTPDSAIKEIIQPYNSFGGRPKESEDHFYIRVSERLRHKARAITIWDYEHIVLEAFPEIYKVKCLNHTSVEPGGGTNELKPGHVLVITVPQLHNHNAANPLKPYTNQDTLTRIENFLKEIVSCFVTVKTGQPLFEEVKISFALKLYDQYKDFTFYANMLRDEITRYLTPWAYTDGTDIRFGGKIYKSSLINFIEERYYVDYITDVVLYHGADVTGDKSLEEITASTSRSILVSAPASKHFIIPAH